MTQVMVVAITAGQFLPEVSGYQLQERYPWFSLPLGSLGQVSIQYHLGVDGLALSMVALSAFVLLLGALASKPDQHSKGYHALFQLLSAAVMGSFLALDQFLFFLFFEFMLLPMYFLIGIWGGVRRTYAAVKFFLYTLLGSVLILVVIIGFASSTLDADATAKRYEQLTQQSITPEAVKIQLANGRLPEQYWVRSFSLSDMEQPDQVIPNALLAPAGQDGKTGEVGGVNARWLAFVLLLIGFTIKLPSVPFHTWLPDAHVEAPTAISVVLAGILLKIGAFGLLRLGYTLLPEQAFEMRHWVAGMGVVSLVYASLIAMAQDDLKKMVAYSSISHMGFVLLGMATVQSLGFTGAIYQLVSHGVLSAFLFLAVGELSHLTGSRSISQLHGLAKVMPRFAALLGAGFFGALGLPLFSGFVAEVLVLMGAVQAAGQQVLSWWLVGLALVSLVITAGYFLWAYRRVMLGKLWVSPTLTTAPHDVSASASLLLLAPLLLSVLLGVWPSVLLPWINQSLSHWMKP